MTSDSAKPTSLRYRVVDVFTQTALEGNPLAVFPNAKGLSSELMQRIARELNLSETVFIEPTGLADCAVALRIFTPVREMLFAGHPTVGASYVAMQEGLVPEDSETFAVEEKIGVIPIRVERGASPRIWLTTPPIQYDRRCDAKTCAEALGLRLEDLLEVQPQILSAGNPNLFIAVRGKGAVDRAWLDSNELRKLQAEGEAPFCVFVFTPTEGGAYSRMFAPDHGVPEDPATGSATGPLGAFMRDHRLLPRGGEGTFVSEQGTKMGRRSLLYFELQGERISVGGYVTPVIEAVLTF